MALGKVSDRRSDEKTLSPGTMDIGSEREVSVQPVIVTSMVDVRVAP